MPRTKIAITLDRDLLAALDRLVREARLPDRSQVIEQALNEMLQRIGRKRLASECAWLDPEFERKLAEAGMANNVREWPEF